MIARRLELATRRGELTALIEVQRQALAANSWPLERALAAGDHARSGIDWLKANPAVVGAAVAAVVIARPKRVLRVARRAFALWRTWHGLRSRLFGA